MNSLRVIWFNRLPQTLTYSKLKFNYSKYVNAMRNLKAKSNRPSSQFFVDAKSVRVVGGKGGDGCISFLRLFANEFAGPDGGDGGNGAHVIFEATNKVRDLNHISQLIRADEGTRGANKDCHGKNAEHLLIKVPVGTIVKNDTGQIVGDLSEEGSMFVAARGGAGGKGNHFFVNDRIQAPKICEFGGSGEDRSYSLELKTMAHIGLIGFPNAGKSTLLNCMTRAKPKVASYPFTTLKPHIGMIQYEDYEQIAVADLPGLIPGSHENKGLGIQFLKHVERCKVLLFLIDVSLDEPWKYYETLLDELEKYSAELLKRPRLLVANKIDVSDENLEELKRKVDAPVLAISAKIGTNVSHLLQEIRIMYDSNLTSFEMK